MYGNVGWSSGVGHQCTVQYVCVIMIVVGSLGNKLGSCCMRKCLKCGDEGVGDGLSRVPLVLCTVV